MLKGALSKAGSYIPMSMFGRIDSALNYAYTGRWMKEHWYSPKYLLKRRRDLIARVVSLIGDAEVLYMEFGVYRGESIRQWSQLLKNSTSRLHGFDSFEGLPEEWDDHSAIALRKGHFSTQGKIPEIPDSRVRFFKGWFEDTLSTYEFIESPTLVIFLDADLYSSTSYVLKTLRPHIKVGTIVYFDEFWDPLHEMKAFEEFLEETRMRFELLAATHGLNNVAFRRIG